MIIISEKNKNSLNNFRDIGEVCTKFPVVHKNLIFRSAQIVNLDRLKQRQLLKQNNIKTIIDLRTIDEIIRYKPYNKQDLEEISYYNVPLECENIVIDEEIKTERNYGPVEYLYFHLLRNEGKSIKKCFEIIADNINFSLVIHCIAGKDRTGIIIALLLKILGINDEEIKKDYLKTPHAKENYFLILITLLNEYGGAIKYLNSIDITDNHIEMIKTNLLKY